MLREIEKNLRIMADPQKAKILASFFKTKKGEYGEGDIFLGVIVPKQRMIAKKYQNISFGDLQELLNSKIHEFRLTALFLLVEKYFKAEENNKKEIVSFYLKNIIRNRINNWDLVDLSAPKILGDYLLVRNKKILYNLASSKNLWQRRIAIISTMSFIKNKKFSDTLKISKILISDREDLIHKAVGWMLREVGKKNLKTEKEFLDKFSSVMPRTMLRYAIEKFNEEDRQKYLFKNK